MNLPLPLQFYRWTTMALAPLSGWMLDQRRKRGKEDGARLQERFGHTSKPRPDGPLLWLHGASVGESRIILDLVKRLETDTDLSFLVTTGTVTSSNLLAMELSQRATHQYIPIDRPACVRRFLDHWRPDAAVFVESELWPNLISEVRQRAIPAALVNARMNTASLDSWSKRRSSAQYLLGAFSWIGAADHQTAKGLSAILDRSIARVGNLKLDLKVAQPNEDELSKLQADLGDRPVWLAASTHEGEDAIVLGAHQEIITQRPDALLILAPRHPERADTISDLIGEKALSSARRSKNELPNKNTQIWLADSLGEMPLWYRLADIAFIGGSLRDGIGGHNPIEATQAGCPVITGPFTASFADVFAAYAEHSATRTVSDSNEIAAAVLAPKANWQTNAEHALSALRGSAMPDTLAAIKALLNRRAL